MFVTVRIVLLLGVAALAGCNGRNVVFDANFAEQAERTDQLDLALGAGDTLELDASFGNIVVSQGGAPSLSALVTGRGRTGEEAREVLDRYTVVAKKEGRTVRVELQGEPLKLVSEGGASMEVAATASFRATVPAGVRVVAETSSGSVTLRGVSGCRAQSSFGNIVVQDSTGSLVGKTSSGSVTFRGIRDGAVRLKSSFGSVSAQGVFRELHAETSSGSVTVTADTGSRVQSDWVLESSFGSVALTIPTDLHCRLDAETSFGSIRVADEFPGERESEVSGGTFSAVVGRGGKTISLETSSGSVSIKAR